MKLKSIILVVVISAATAILSVWGYSNFFQKSYTGTQEPGKLPVNYAGFFDRNTPPAKVMDFTAAESDAAVALMGCDCPACMRVLHQLQSQTFSQVLLSSNQGHCWNALRQRPPQETQEVLRGLEVEKENE